MYTPAQPAKRRISRGLGETSPRGTRITYTAEFGSGSAQLRFPKSYPATVADVTKILSQKSIVVEHASSATTGHWYTAFISGIQTFTLDLRIAADYGDVDDVRRVVDNAFYQATGMLPGASRIDAYIPTQQMSSGASSSSQQAARGSGGSVVVPYNYSNGSTPQPEEGSRFPWGVVIGGSAGLAGLVLIRKLVS